MRAVDGLGGITAVLRDSPETPPPGWQVRPEIRALFLGI